MAKKPTKQQVADRALKRSKKDTALLKEAAIVTATVVGPGKVIKGAKVAAKGAKAVRDVVRGKRTYYHGSPNEIPKGATLKTRGSKGTSSATNKKKLAEQYSKSRLTLTPEGLKKTSGNVYKVKSKSGKVTKTKTFEGKAREFEAKDFIVIKKVK